MNKNQAISKVIAPAALFYFRWAAFGTIVSGLILSWLNGYTHEALTLGVTSGGGKKYCNWYWYVVRHNNGF